MGNPTLSNQWGNSYIIPTYDFRLDLIIKTNFYAMEYTVLQISVSDIGYITFVVQHRGRSNTDNECSGDQVKAQLAYHFKIWCLDVWWESAYQNINIILSVP